MTHRRRRRRTLLPILALTLTLTAAACGDDGGGPSNNASASNNGGSSNNAAASNNAASNNASGNNDGSNNGAGNNAPASNNGTAGTNNGSTGGPVDWPEDESELPARPWSVEARGHYNVGFRTMEVSYTPQGMEAPRTMEVSLWYPTRQLDGPAPLYSELVSRDGEGVYVYADASVAIEEPAPLLIFSMGHMGFAEQSYFMTEFFASHGWVVAAPTHTGNTIFDLGDRPSEMFEWRPQDISQTLDVLEALPAEHPLAGLVGEEVMLSGHSYGGYTTLASAGASFDVDGMLEDCTIVDDDDCSYITGSAEARYRAGFGDDRIGAFAPLAPGNFDAFSADGVAAVEAPVILMTGLLDRSLADETNGTPYWEALSTDTAIRVQFLTGGHHTFSNSCQLAAGVFGNDGCSEEFIPSEEAHAVINAMAMAFARRHLFGDDSDADLLDGSRSLHDDVEVLNK